MSVATIIVKADVMPCGGEGWRYLVSTKPEVIKANCGTCYKRAWTCGYGVR